MALTLFALSQIPLPGSLSLSWCESSYHEWLSEELLHSIACRVVEWEWLYVRSRFSSNVTHRKGTIVIGHGGAVLKAAGEAARAQLPDGHLLGSRGSRRAGLAKRSKRDHRPTGLLRRSSLLPGPGQVVQLGNSSARTSSTRRSISTSSSGEERSVRIP